MGDEAPAEGEAPAAGGGEAAPAAEGEAAPAAEAAAEKKEDEGEEGAKEGEEGGPKPPPPPPPPDSKPAEEKPPIMDLEEYVGEFFEEEGMIEEEEERVVLTRSQILAKQLRRQEKLRRRRLLGFPTESFIRDNRRSVVLNKQIEFEELVEAFESTYKGFRKDVELSDEEELALEELAMEKPVLDRKSYYRRLEVAQEKLNEEKVKNQYINMKLVENYRRHNQMHLLEEIEYAKIPESQEKSYHNKLFYFGEIQSTFERDTIDLNEEIERLHNENDAKQEEATQLFDALQKREKEIGMKRLVAASKQIPKDEIVRRLLGQQATQIDNLHAYRIKFITIREKLAELEKILKMLNDLGEHTILDFEQLKVTNRTLSDKVEDQDRELLKFRGRVKSNIENLAHVREKICALTEDTEKLAGTLQITLERYEARKKKITKLLKEDNDLKGKIKSLIQEGGLLHLPKLLLDMSKTNYKMAGVNNKIEKIIKEYNENEVLLQNLRGHVKLYDYESRVAFKCCNLKNTDYLQSDRTDETK